MIINTGNDMHYPVRVVKLMRQNGDSVKLGSVLFEYEYTTLVAKGEDMEEKPTKFYAEFSSEGEGMLKNTFVRRGQTISGPGVPLVEIEEDCTHEVQFGGLCVVCGKDMDEITYMTTVANTERAQINMVHGSKDLKVSAREAGRTSTSAMKRLLREQKLSLVVDLDQTIIHAVCDPTVAEWQKDPLNPNYEAVKDVQSFELMDEGPNARASTYYIKMRPGLRDFLNKMADNYELHIYTMGTRAYAESVAKIIDPTGRLFGDRILSRDESGSMAVKNLSRLFPVDTKMVVIIDDRADVWTWSPNLVRVKAYVFYVGIGDINSSFLPKLEDSAAPVEKPEAVIAVAKVVDEPEDEPEPEANGTSDETASSIDPAEAPSVETASHLQAEAIAAQIQERPLLKLQETLDKADSEEEEARKEHKSEEIQENGAPKPNEPETTTPPSTPPAHRHPLLRNDDDELTFLTKHLSILHDLFFDVYNTNMVMAKDEHEFDEGYEAEDDLELVPDVQDIMPPMKRDVLRGVVICFTGVIPQGINHEQ
jgi:RNA polymerase II subunit A-like phosphatase